jgi:arylsulfatase A-like enzyme
MFQPILALILALGPLVPQTSQPRTQDETAPAGPLNVVLILADDLGYGDLGCYGGSIPTPHLDALAAEGVRFTSAYVTAPTCSPSRAGLMTGRHQQRFGFEFNTGSAGMAASREQGLPPGVPTLAERMRAAGCGTGMVGKWHLGLRADAHPLERGFGEFYGFIGGARGYLPATKGYKTNPLLRGREEITESEYLTDAFAREAVAFIERHASERFFLYLPFSAPHVPHEVADAYLAHFPDLAGDQRIYAAMVSALDDGVGRVLAALVDSDLADRTLVVFLSDNGAVAGDGQGSNGPLRLGKFSLFEGGLRVPLIVRDPRASGRGRVEPAPVSSLDLFPTLLAAAGGDVAAAGVLDGRDLTELLAGAGSPKDPPPLRWRSGPSSALRSGRFKLIRSAGNTWLFDVEDDPGEDHDLAAERAELVATLQQELDAWTAQLVPPLWPGKAYEQEPVVHGKTLEIDY